MNEQQIRKSTETLGEPTVEMLKQVHADALWMLENMGVGCTQPEIQQAFRRFEPDGEALFHENRIYLSESLVERCLSTVPGVDRFFVPRQSLFIGGTAPYVYDDAKGQGGILPEPEHVARIARIADETDVIAGMGRGVKLKDQIAQMNIMAEHCAKPLYVAVTSDETLERARQIHAERGNLMVVFCLTRPMLQVNENFSEHFVKVVRAGLPIFVSAMPMGGISAPFCYSGILAVTHAEVLFGICAAQMLAPGIPTVHAGYPTIADPRFEYNPNYGLRSHFLLNILQTHLNLMLDLPACQSLATTNEEHLTERALEDARIGQAMAKRYGIHMMRHPFAFLRHLVDFSFAKLEKTIEIAREVRAEDAPDMEMPTYDPRGMASIRRVGLGMYLHDDLTTANMGKVFVE